MLPDLMIIDGQRFTHPYYQLPAAKDLLMTPRPFTAERELENIKGF